MRSAIVPSQVTTVEDKIVGNISLSQALLLAIPIVGGCVAFALLPPFYTYSGYKIGIVVFLAIVGGALAIRIRERILFSWIIIALFYNARPRYYIFNKNDDHLRYKETYNESIKTNEQQSPATSNKENPTPLSTADLVAIENIIDNPEANLHFKINRKGELRVHVTEIQ